MDASTVGLVYKPSSDWEVPRCTNPLMCMEWHPLKPWPSFVGENCPYDQMIKRLFIWSCHVIPDWYLIKLIWSCLCLIKLSVLLYSRTQKNIPMFGCPLRDGNHKNPGTGWVASARWFQPCCFVCPCLKRAPKVLGKYVFWMGGSSTNPSDFNRLDREILIIGSAYSINQWTNVD